MRGMLLTATLTLIIQGTAIAHNQDPNKVSNQVTMELTSGATYEDCTTLNKAQQISYQFSANNKVEFNIHYHLKGKAYFPVFPTLQQQSQDTFKANHNSEYCLTWINRTKQNLSLKYAYQLLSTQSAANLP